jgi:hypothetical protein
MNIMRKVMIALSMGLVFAACNNQATQPSAIDTMAIKQQAIAEEQARIRTADSIEAAVRKSLAVQRRREPRYDDASLSSAEHAPVTPTTAAPAKKGMSDAAKGTIIGAGAGALAGVLIDKNDARGAVIGGVVGAGTGYAIGRANDRKTGRVVKKPATTNPPQQ